MKSTSQLQFWLQYSKISFDKRRPMASRDALRVSKVAVSLMSLGVTPTSCSRALKIFCGKPSSCRASNSMSWLRDTSPGGASYVE